MQQRESRILIQRCCLPLSHILVRVSIYRNNAKRMGEGGYHSPLLHFHNILFQVGNGKLLDVRQEGWDDHGLGKYTEIWREILEKCHLPRVKKTQVCDIGKPQNMC